MRSLWGLPLQDPDYIPEVPPSEDYFDQEEVTF